MSVFKPSFPEARQQFLFNCCDIQLLAILTATRSRVRDYSAVVLKDIIAIKPGSTGTTKIVGVPSDLMILSVEFQEEIGLLIFDCGEEMEAVVIGNAKNVLSDVVPRNNHIIYLRIMLKVFSCYFVNEYLLFDSYLKNQRFK
jgi:hypothetical protein